MESIAETKVCRHCNSKFEITDKDLAFYEKVSPVFPQNGELSSKNGEIRKLIKPLSSKFSDPNSFKYLIPYPNLCHDCRQQRRLSFYNLRNLYKNKCGICHKDIVSRISPNGNLKTYCNKCWSEGEWDKFKFGIDFDFSKSFFEQIDYLIKNTPFQNLIGSYSNVKNNAVYTNHTADISNSYLVFDSDSGIENCIYSQTIRKGKNIVDCLVVSNSEECYEVVNGDNLYKVFYSNNSSSSSYCYYIDNCHGCNNCIGCVNLINKEYYILNNKLSKEEYRSFIKDLNKNIYSKDFQEKYNKLKKYRIYKYAKIVGSENCTGDYIYNSKNCESSFDIVNCEDCKYSSSISSSTDLYDISSYGSNSYLMYDSVSVGRYSNNILFSSIVGKGENLTYCIDVKKSNNCFGCVNLEEVEYCILNKQYTKEEYEKIVPKIIEKMKNDGEWGEFFPSSLSPFGYNETVAQEYFPLTREEVIGEKITSAIPADAGIYSKEKVIEGNNDSENLKSNNSKVDSKHFREFIDSGSSKEGQTTNFLHGPIFNRSDYESLKPKVYKIIPASKLPRNIKEIPDDILNWAIECELTGKPFRIIREELEFYRKHKLPIPRKHPDQRHLDRMKLRNPRKLYDRLCDCEKCEENSKKAGTFKQEEFALKDSELNSEGQRRKIKTTYSPDRKEIVYCEECYNKEVY